MRLPFVNQGPTPSNDGTVTRFVSPKVQDKGWYNPARPAFFVSGMQNTGDEHARNARPVADGGQPGAGGL